MVGVGLLEAELQVLVAMGIRSSILCSAQLVVSFHIHILIIARTTGVVGRAGQFLLQDFNVAVVALHNHEATVDGIRLTDISIQVAASGAHVATPIFVSAHAVDGHVVGVEDTVHLSALQLVEEELRLVVDGAVTIDVAGGGVGGSENLIGVCFVEEGVVLRAVEFEPGLFGCVGQIAHIHGIVNHLRERGEGNALVVVLIIVILLHERTAHLFGQLGGEGGGIVYIAL